MYTIDSASIPLGYQFFYMTQESECANNSLESDTITPIEFAISHSDVSCWDDNDGQITVEVLSTMLTPFSYYINGVLNPAANIVVRTLFTSKSEKSISLFKVESIIVPEEIDLIICAT